MVLTGFRESKEVIMESKSKSIISCKKVVKPKKSESTQGLGWAFTDSGP